MLGHKAFQEFSKSFNTYASFRNFTPSLKGDNVFPLDKVIEGINVFDFGGVEHMIRELQPHTIVNCIGIIKQLEEAHDKRISIYINSLFPHLLHEVCENTGARLIHISTDCVFSGKQGNYTDADTSDATDLYGRTKYLGEVENYPSLTLRTSIIGHGLFRNSSLVDWFLSQNFGKVKGFQHAIYTGFPTVIFCRELVRVVKDFPQLSGLYNFASNKISKYELLLLIREIYGLSIEIEPYEDFYCDRSMSPERYQKVTNFQTPSWRSMIEEMHKDHLEHTYYRNLNET